MGLAQPQLSAPKHPLDRIAFAGPMCSGKTTMSNLFVDAGYSRVGFAMLLKQTAADLYGPIEKDDAGRKLLQEFADDLKKWDANLFTTHLLLDVEFEQEYFEQTKFVLDDLRFLHEEKALRNNGFTIIQLRCDETVRQQRIKELYPDTNPSRFQHPSEIEWSQMHPDYIIDSTGYGGIIEINGLIKDVTGELV